MGHPPDESGVSKHHHTAGLNSYRPDGATTLTFLGQDQRDFPQALNFLPYEGTVVRAPYGRIPTNAFISDPALSRFDREQSFVGCEFEHSFANDITVRQNLRYAEVDVHDIDPFAQGCLEPPMATSALLARSTFATSNKAGCCDVRFRVTRSSNGVSREGRQRAPRLSLKGGGRDDSAAALPRPPWRAMCRRSIHPSRSAEHGNRQPRPHRPEGVAPLPGLHDLR